MTNLTSLNISRCKKITEVGISYFSDLPRLTDLDIDKSKNVNLANLNGQLSDLVYLCCESGDPVCGIYNKTSTSRYSNSSSSNSSSDNSSS